MILKCIRLTKMGHNNSVTIIIKMTIFVIQKKRMEGACLLLILLLSGQ